MSIKKISTYLMTLMIVISLSYFFCNRAHSSILDKGGVAALEIKNSSPEINKISVDSSDNSTESVKAAIEPTAEPTKVNSYLVISFLLLLGLNVITGGALLRVLAWRKTAANGMMAVVPSEVISSFGVVSQKQNKLAQWLQSEVLVISKALSDQVQSIAILKKELEAKDADLAYFRAGASSIEKDKVISKLVKLHYFLKTLEEQVLAGGIKHEVAIGFLKDELADLFVEFNITEISPAPLTPLKNLPIEGYSVKDVVQVNDARLNQTVAELLESGYYHNFADGKGRVIRAAILKINKLGE